MQIEQEKRLTDCGATAGGQAELAVAGGAAEAEPPAAAADVPGRVPVAPARLSEAEEVAIGDGQAEEAAAAREVG